MAGFGQEDPADLKTGAKNEPPPETGDQDDSPHSKTAAEILAALYGCSPNECLFGFAGQSGNWAAKFAIDGKDDDGKTHVTLPLPNRPVTGIEVTKNSVSGELASLSPQAQLEKAFAMAALAMANPNLRGGVHVEGTDAEKLILLTATLFFGLKTVKADYRLVLQAKEMAKKPGVQAIWNQFKADLPGLPDTPPIDLGAKRQKPGASYSGGEGEHPEPPEESPDDEQETPFDGTETDGNGDEPDLDDDGQQNPPSSPLKNIFARSAISESAQDILDEAGIDESAYHLIFHRVLTDQDASLGHMIDLVNDFNRTLTPGSTLKAIEESAIPNLLEAMGADGVITLDSSSGYGPPIINYDNTGNLKPRPI